MRMNVPLLMEVVNIDVSTLMDFLIAFVKLGIKKIHMTFGSAMVVIVTVNVCHLIYVLLNLSYIDIDECALNQNDCEQQCFNGIGSYTCGCNGGCEFNETARTCQG